MTEPIKFADKLRGASEKRPRKKMFIRHRSTSVRSEIVIPMHATPRGASPGLISTLWNIGKNKDAAASSDQDGIIDDVDETSGEFTVMDSESPPTDSTLNGFFDTESIGVAENNDALRVKIVKDKLKNVLLELMRSHGGNVRALEEIESDTVSLDTMDHLVNAASQIEKNIAFLWCAFTKRPELLAELHRSGAQVDFCEPSEGFSALHLSAFSGCTACARHLLAAGVDVNYALRSYTPLHCAAFGNSVATAQLLIDGGARTDVACAGGDVARGTAIHSAVAANAVECVQLLVRYCVDIDDTEPTGAAPIHVAADLGHAQCLAAILDAGGADVNAATREKRSTAAHLAAEGGYAGCLAALIEGGADVDAKNAKGQTPLHLAAKTQSIECVEMLLKVGRCNPMVVDLDLRTPLHCAMGRAQLAVEVAEMLIRSWRAQVNLADRYGHTPLHTASNNELSQCVDLLLLNNADVTARTKGGVTALNLIVKKTPACLTTVSDILDRAISMHDPENSRQEVELKMNFRCILPRARPRMKLQEKEISFLNTFVEEGQKEFLQHPLCEAFLYLKWKKVRKYYVCRLIFCAFFVGWLTGYVINALAHNCYNLGKNITNFVPTTDLNSSAYNESTALCQGAYYEFIRNHTIFVDMQWYVLIAITFFEIVRKLYGVAGYLSFRQYFSEIENYCEWFVIVSVLAISCVYENRTYAWQNYLAAFAVLCAWTNLMHMIGQLPALGSYVAMYTKVQREFAKLLLAYICLLVGFTASFCVLYPATSEFANPFIGFINVLIMMSGEIRVDSLLKIAEGGTSDSDSYWLLYVSAHAIYILFLLMVTVVLMNLLVGIAVNDIQGLKKTAGLSKLVQQTQLINYIERALFNKLFNNMLPERLKKVLTSTAQFSYRVVLELKPLNPRENRLPKEILVTAYERAKNLRQGGAMPAASVAPASAEEYKYNFKQRVGYQPKRSMVRRFGKQVSVESLQSEVEESSMVLMRLSAEVTELKDSIKKLVEALAKKD